MDGSDRESEDAGAAQSQPPEGQMSRIEWPSLVRVLAWTLAITFIANGTFYDNSGQNDPNHNSNHGTAVLGELVGQDNGFGVTGIVPRAAMSVVNASSKGSRSLRPAAFTRAGRPRSIPSGSSPCAAPACLPSISPKSWALRDPAFTGCLA